MNFLIKPLLNKVTYLCNKLSDFRATLKLMAELCFEMSKENYEQVKTDVEENKKMLEKLEI